MTATMMSGLGIFCSIMVVSSPAVHAEETALFTKTTLKPEFRERYIDTVRKSLVETRKEDSPSKFDFYQDAATPEVFYQFEVWSGADTQEAHLKKPYAVAEVAARKEAQVAEPEVIKLVPYRSDVEGRSPEGETSGTQNLIVVFQPKEQLKEEFLSEFDKVIAEARKAEGNLAFELYRSVEPAGKFVLYERWESPAHYAKHLATPYVADFYKHFDAVVDQRVRYAGKDLSAK